MQGSVQLYLQLVTQGTYFIYLIHFLKVHLTQFPSLQVLTELVYKCITRVHLFLKLKEGQLLWQCIIIIIISHCASGCIRLSHSQ